MNKMSVKQGENTDLFIITIQDLIDYTDYYSDLSVVAADTDTVVLGPLRIEAVDNKFSVALSPAQTAQLPIGGYTVVLEVVKDVASVVEFRKELSWPLKVTKSIINT